MMPFIEDEAPQATILAPSRVSIAHSPWSVGWLVLFALNLIMPLNIGWPMVGSAGAVGLTLAVLFSAVFGFTYVAAYPWIRLPALLGAIVLALSQFYPLLQIGAGVAGSGLAQALAATYSKEQTFRGDLGLVSGFYATFVTGQVLILLSVVIGGTLTMIGRLCRRAVAVVRPPGVAIGLVLALLNSGPNSHG